MVRVVERKEERMDESRQHECVFEALNPLISGFRSQESMHAECDSFLQTEPVTEVIPPKLADWGACDTMS